MTASAVETLPFPLWRRGKVRDVYDVDAGRLLLVASDRVSAFDVVMREHIPHKGVVLTQMTAWWLRQLEADIPHHMITANVDDIVSQLPSLEPHRNALAGRAMLCVRTDVFPVECVVRGYLTGSAWKEYSASGTLAGEPLPAGLAESQRLVPAIFSPATKAEVGHDENITLERLRTMIGEAAAGELERLSRLVYHRGQALAESRGIVIADTKFEFGRAGGRTLLVDEVLTPDSSRFWPARGYAPGRSQPSFDKQPLRDYLAGVRAAGRWNGNAPPPALPDEIVRATSRRYLDAYQRITGSALVLSEPL